MYARAVVGYYGRYVIMLRRRHGQAQEERSKLVCAFFAGTFVWRGTSAPRRERKNDMHAMARGGHRIGSFLFLFDRSVGVCLPSRGQSPCLLLQHSFIDSLIILIQQLSFRAKTTILSLIPVLIRLPVDHEYVCDETRRQARVGAL